jgi:ADP-heptose:LPS heptosyltransferase
VAAEWYRQKGGEFDEIHMFCLPDHSTCLYEGMGVPWKIIHTPEPPYQVEINFDVARATGISTEKRCHLVNAYAEIAKITTDRLQPIPNYQPPEMEVPEDKKNLIMVSMFSRSCTSRSTPPQPPNKMLLWNHWKPLLELLRSEYPDGKLALLGGPEDRLRPEYGLNVSEDEYLLAIPLPLLANYMRYAKCVVTVDNGMAHLAASQRANQFYMASAALALHFIVPWGNRNMRVAHVNPMTVNPETLRVQLYSAIQDWKVSNGSKPDDQKV